MMSLITINENSYYNTNDLFVHNKDFFYGCSDTKRTIIVKKNIPESEYLYATFATKKNRWNLTTSKCNKANLFISKAWVDAHFFNTKPVHLTEDEDKGDKEENITELVEKSPPLLSLEEHEKFKDADGNVLEIETRGEKTQNGIFFKVVDVMKAFDMPNLKDSLINTTSCYSRNDDYFVFFIQTSAINNCLPLIKKYLYLSYEGMLRVLFVSRNDRVKPFMKWATKTLFTHQMGSEEDKQVLGTDLLNLSLKTYRAVFKSYASKFPCIYLLSLGKVGALRETFGIASDLYKDDAVVYKYGFTEDLERRLSEHETKYGKLANVVVQLSTFQMIDVKYTSDAEGDFRHTCKSFQKSLEVPGYHELIVLDEKELGQMKKQFRYIGNDYAGASADLQRKIQELEDENRELKRDIVEKDLRYEILERDGIHQHKLFESEKKYYELQLVVLRGLSPAT